MVAWHESHPLYISSNGKLPNWGQTYLPLWKLTGYTLVLSGSTRVRIHQRWWATHEIDGSDRTIVIIEPVGERFVGGWPFANHTSLWKKWSLYLWQLPPNIGRSANPRSSISAEQRRFRVDPLWHARDPYFNSLASAQCNTFLMAYFPECQMLPSRQAKDNSSRSRKIVDSRVYKRSWVSRVARNVMVV